MERLCLEAGLMIARFPAVDSKLLNEADSDAPLLSTATILKDIPVTKKWDSTLNSMFDATCMANPGVVMSASERACALSHVMVWEAIAAGIVPSKEVTEGDTSHMPTHALVGSLLKEEDFKYKNWIDDFVFAHSQKSNFPSLRDVFGAKKKQVLNDPRFFLVLEDDALLHEKGSKASFAAHVNFVAESLPLDCDMCYLGYAANWAMQTDDSSRFNSDVESIFFVPSYLWQLHGYLLTANGARKLLTHLPIDAPVDNFIAKLVYEKKIKVTFILIALLLHL